MKTSHTSQRILSLDILRGITIAGMIMVNNPGTWSHIYAPLRHAEWNGLTPTDLVFPFFMFIMGISTYISLKKYDFQFSRAAGMKILRRTLVIFLIGIAIGWFSKFCYYWPSAPDGLSFGEKLWNAVWTFDRIRISGVMQRLAVCYGAASIVALTVKHRYIPYLIAALLTGYFLLLMAGNGFAYDETNILSVVDRSVLTPAHMYNDNGIDPEGILSTIPSIAHVLLGFCVGRIIFNKETHKEHKDIINTLFIVGTILTFSGLLLSYGCPVNKKIWSPTFVLTTCGLASNLLALLTWIIDVKGHKKWSLFFEAFGVNPLFMYVLGGVLSILTGSIRIPYAGEMMSIRRFMYQEMLMPVFGETGGSFAFAVIFIVFNWCIGYQLYKRKIYIKI